MKLEQQVVSRELAKTLKKLEQNLTRELKAFLHQAQIELLEAVLESIDEELRRWNGNGEYYDNVTKFSFQVKQSIKESMRE